MPQKKKQEKIKGIKNKEKALDKDMEALKKEIEELKKELESQKVEKEKLMEEYEKIKNYAITLKIDFENYKDIVQKEKMRIKKETKEGVIKQLLPIYKNFSIVMKNQENLNIFAKGVEMIYKSFVKTIEDIGIEFIMPDKNDKFDPFEHDAIEKVETDEVEEYHVYSLESPGIKLEGKIIEPAKVKVAIKPQKKQEEDKKEDEKKDAERGE
ncbi:molecular chaperone GrpE [Marinitoga hydrogenitolerans DSM 16785]|uniref:Protein GrpE n=1 Tax=Marinitoga hydrogenitolerans (strain DSM 16785 / JCM 12826 / AT1271) TaxID=1122195 RepID=A0A1M4TEP6_MARH1|nr:nucleotide exchange factor GrpE [Marinitoga hydrogenitolerans]SHE42923.1 molecular chaperone GrpE [Marinitoga hydrogenitolerans DSM 16785]